MLFFQKKMGIIIIPTDFHIFQRGRYTTNQYLSLRTTQMRTARLVIGAHGGALANLLFAPKNAGGTRTEGAYPLVIAQKTVENHIKAPF